MQGSVTTKAMVFSPWLLCRRDNKVVGKIKLGLAATNLRGF
jgi:hypothetical protein